jgi:hypothetical protein
MRRSIVLASLAVFGVSIAGLWSCSGTSNGGDGGNPGNDAGNMGTDSGTDAGTSMDAGGNPDAGGNTDAGTTNDAGETDSGTNDAGSLTTLTVHNYDEWCTISINGGAFSIDDPQSVQVAPGLIPLAAGPKNSGFELGPWFHTAGDHDGGGDPGILDGGISYTAVNVGTSAACVFICCPFSDGTGCTGVSDPCP